eukprot:TRINITY_DN41911_c0_g1_i1.p1 TRINITY_DN41911_c0_g1~~TRINITY_DN41911_c0_g1_i1.p1  ORF type:complete len:332 (+),score=44.72 TRINITY_DN41911_c0_g1_i1:62-1057(+)
MLMMLLLTQDLQFLDRYVPLLLWVLYTCVYIAVTYHCVFRWHGAPPSEELWRCLPLSELGLVLLVSYTSSMGMMGVAHLAVMTSDAGAIVPPAVPPVSVHAPRYCKFCPGSSWKPARAHHCPECDACVFMRHHHCWIIRNCVGWGNQKVFWLFLFYSACALSFSLALLAAATGHWLLECVRFGPSWSLRACASSVAAAWCCCRGLQHVAENIEEQWKSLRYNMLPTEKVRGLFGAPEASWQGRLRQALGSPCWLWFLPIAAKSDPDLLDKVFQHNPFSGRIEEAPSSALDGHPSAVSACRPPSTMTLLSARHRQDGSKAHALGHAGMMKGL